ncbi:META domain-containing protein [Paracoccus sanguinis]|uniref:META domain-containing protein n=1 Tax=Paracoccus sanguinis TaxID=1545044 RepID=UPI001451F72D|nr:META domain-containing protein [Paracoccus sanguinis]QJD17623.1 META domain-containing protein [Paracoccus sanguinis]
MKRLVCLSASALALAALAACGPAAPAPGTEGMGFEGGIPFGTYTVVGFGKESVPTRSATIRLTKNAFSGNGPCNTFTGVNAATLPAIQVATMNWTDNPCGHKGFEGRFINAVTQANEAVWEGGVLKIKNPLGWITAERSGN